MRLRICHKLIAVGQVAYLFIAVITLPLNNAHRQRPVDQGPSTKPTARPSSKRRSRSPTVRSSNQRNNTLKPSSFVSRKPTKPSIHGRTPSASPTPSLMWDPALQMPSLTPSQQPSPNQPTESPSNPFEFRTLPCSYDSSIEGYDDQDSFLRDIDEIQVEKPFLLCPNITFDDMNIVLTERDVPLNIECGGEGCVWSRTTLIITGPTAPISFRGIIFEASAETFLVASGTDASISFTECSWYGSFGKEVIRIDGEESPSDQDNMSKAYHLLNAERTANRKRSRRNFDSQSTFTRSSTQAKPLYRGYVDGEDSIKTLINNFRERSTKEEKHYKHLSTYNTTPGLVQGSSRFLERGHISLSLSMCSFMQNVVSASIVASQYGDIRLEDCTFEMNEVTGGSLVHVVDGKVDLRGARFERNSFDESEGLIFASTSQSLQYDESTCASNNTSIFDNGAKGCKGLFINESQDCIQLELCNTFSPTESPSIAPSIAPSFLRRDCYNTLQGLQAAIVDAEERDKAALIRVCADSTLDANVEYMFSPLKVTKGSISIECGDSGTLDEGCIIFGGFSNQVYIGPKVEAVTFAGFSMVDAGIVSVLAAGVNRSEATFRNCQWKYNRGVAAVLVYNEASGEPYIGQGNLEQLAPPRKPSMSVRLYDCFFEENTFSYSTIAAIRARLSVKSTLFRDNGISRLGPIAAMVSSVIQISSSCFISNHMLLHGVVMIDATSNITENGENFGADNDSILGDCTTIFDDTYGTCAIDGICEGVCIPFAAESCDKSVSDVDHQIKETPPPMRRPTREPGATSPPSSTNPSSNGTSAGQSGESQNSSVTASPGAIIMIVALALFVLCIIWTYCRRRTKERGGKPGKKGASRSSESSMYRRPLFGRKEFPPKARIVQENRNGADSDEFHDYDKILDHDSEDVFDDDYVGENEVNSDNWNKNKRLQRGWLSRGTTKQKGMKKGTLEPYHPKHKHRKVRAMKKKQSSFEDDDSSDSDNSEEVQNSGDSSEEAEIKCRGKDKRIKKTSKTKSRNRRRQRRRKSGEDVSSSDSKSREALDDKSSSDDDVKPRQRKDGKGLQTSGDESMVLGNGDHKDIITGGGEALDNSTTLQDSFNPFV